MSIKRYLAAALCALILVSLAACTNNTGASETTPNATAPSETTQTPTPPTPSFASTPLAVNERQRVQDFLNDPENATLITSHTVHYPITVLGGEIDDQGRRLVSYVDAELGTAPYLMTLSCTQNSFQIISDVEIDDNVLNTLYATATEAYQKSPASERNIGELQLETMVICRLDDGKYYQICLYRSYDSITVFVSQSELDMSSIWDFIPIGDRATFTMENLGKIKESNA